MLHIGGGSIGCTIGYTLSGSRPLRGEMHKGKRRFDSGTKSWAIMLKFKGGIDPFR